LNFDPSLQVQFDYGLRQKRHLRTTERPATFVSATGKKIHADQSLAIVNDAKLREGEVSLCENLPNLHTTKIEKRVHKTLEKAIHPDVVPIEVQSSEERWALRSVLPPPSSFLFIDNKNQNI
jgi:exonuclease V